MSEANHMCTETRQYSSDDKYDDKELYIGPQSDQSVDRGIDTRRICQSSWEDLLVKKNMMAPPMRGVHQIGAGHQDQYSLHGESRMPVIGTTK
jgi:hypothetical protein